VHVTINKLIKTIYRTAAISVLSVFLAYMLILT